MLPLCYLAQGDIKVVDGSIQNEGVEIYYETIGQGDPLLLLSGGPGFDPDYLIPLAQELGKSYQCILLEQRGTGRSQPAQINSTTINLTSPITKPCARILLSSAGRYWGIRMELFSR